MEITCKMNSSSYINICEGKIVMFFFYETMVLSTYKRQLHVAEVEVEEGS